MNCENTQIDLSAYIDGELSDPRVQEVELHLNNCSACGELLQLLDSTRTAFREIKPDQVSAGFQQEVKEAYNKTASRPTFPWLYWAAPVALAASLALVFMWSGRSVMPAAPMAPSGPMSGPEIYDQMLTLDMPGSDIFLTDEDMGRFSNGFPGSDPVKTIPGMGDYYNPAPGSSS